MRGRRKEGFLLSMQFLTMLLFQDGSNEAIQVPMPTAQDVADLPPEHTSVHRHCMQSLWRCPHRQKGPSPSLGSLYCGYESHSTPQSHPACQQCWGCKAIKVDSGKTWKQGYLLPWKQGVHPFIAACFFMQSLGAKRVLVM